MKTLRPKPVQGVRVGRAVTRQGGQTFVFVAAQQNGHLIAQQTAVTVGDTVGNNYSIASGLKAGDKVTVPFKVTRQPDSKTPITLQQLPVGQGNQQAQQAAITVSNAQPLPPITPDKNDGEIVLDVKANAAPGTYTVALKASSPMLPYSSVARLGRRTDGRRYVG